MCHTGVKSWSVQEMSFVSDEAPVMALLAPGHGMDYSISTWRAKKESLHLRGTYILIQ